MRKYFVLLLLLLSSSAFAAGVGRDLVLIGGRGPGAFGSLWLTDVVITNANRSGPVLDVGVSFLASPEGRQKMIRVAAGQTIVLKDVLHTTFGIEQSLGVIRVATSDENARLTARARIYNVHGSAGEFGQIVPAFPSASLGREFTIGGLSGTGGNRTNIGFTAPNIGFTGPQQEAVLSLTLLDASGNERATKSLTVPGGTVFQNDVFATFDVTPFDEAALRVISSTPVYAFASVIRNDSGDADFIAGAADDRAESGVVQPACVNPAALRLSPVPYPGYIVVFPQAVDANAKTAELEAKYGFKAKHIYTSALSGFAAEMTPEAIAGIRCEANVDFVEEDSWATVF